MFVLLYATIVCQTLIYYPNGMEPDEFRFIPSKSRRIIRYAAAVVIYREDIHRSGPPHPRV